MKKQKLIYDLYQNYSTLKTKKSQSQKLKMNLPVSIASAKDLNTFVKKIAGARLTTLHSFFSGKPRTKIPEVGGIYLFWWSGEKDLFLQNIKTHKHLIKGKQTEEEKVDIRFTEQWIEMATFSDKICLYVGKTTNLKQRISSHIKPKTQNIWGDTQFDSGRKPNTTSQMRIGVEKIFKNKAGLEIILSNVSVSYLELDGIKHCVNRFYLEDLSVGTYFPLLNIDIER